MGLLTDQDVGRLGLGSIGENVMISDRCSIYGASAISLGDNVRIDDFAVLTARKPVEIGDYVHIGAFSFLSGQFGLVVEDFCNVSPYSALLSGNDDFSGQCLPGPLIPEDLRQVEGGVVRLGKYAMLGTHSVVLAGASLGEGVAVGALSLVKEPLPPWGVYAGVPARFIRARERNVAALADRLRSG